MPLRYRKSHQEFVMRCLLLRLLKQHSASPPSEQAYFTPEGDLITRQQGDDALRDGTAILIGSLLVAEPEVPRYNVLER